MCLYFLEPCTDWTCEQRLKGRLSRKWQKEILFHFTHWKRVEWKLKRSQRCWSKGLEGILKIAKAMRSWERRVKTHFSFWTSKKGMVATKQLDLSIRRKARTHTPCTRTQHTGRQSFLLQGQFIVEPQAEQLWAY